MNEYIDYQRGGIRVGLIKYTLITALFIFSSTVYAVPITSLELTGGAFEMSGYGGTMTPAAYANMSVDGVTYDGEPPSISTSDFSSTSIGTFQFGFFGPVAIYTAPFDDVPNGPFPAVTGDVTGGVLSLDLSSWTAWWSGTAFNQGTGGPIAATSYNPVTGDLTADWMSLVVGGPFNGQTGTWHIEANAQVVPVPAAVWLFGSGLFGLLGVTRLRKTCRSIATNTFS